ncbi:ABC transporter ATP-binding protein [Pelagibacterium limicola]|uniref:ABC transporter ATP-binding protein n=1 Tax=Pelagibacterium limicola TaxID=2791022 RepID=UPI0018AF8601|nr:sn-glycerol-3-phosphate ABC transporter ATP-binding protein UgpC [Pelagibacterium limicola]
MADLRLRQIVKNYGAVPVIRNLDLDIAHGELVVFVGPSGCGKSTLLRMIAGLEDITGGDLFIGDRLCNDVAPRDRGIAMVFQSYALYPHMTVYDNVGFSLKLAGDPPKVRDEKIREAARILKMGELLDRKPAQLSGGQRQRVAIGRAIVRQPQVFLFDEPLSNLDAALRVEMRMEIAKLHQQLGATMIYVTHDQVEAMTLADKIVVLDHGVVQQIGSPLELYRAPANLFVAGFIGSPKMNLLQVGAVSVDGSGIKIGSDDVSPVVFSVPHHGVAPGDALVLGVRPQDLVIGGPDSFATGVVQIVERLGSETVLNLATRSGETVIVTTTGDAEVSVGEEIGFGFDPAKAHLFLPTGAAVTNREKIVTSKAAAAA